MSRIKPDAGTQWHAILYRLPESSGVYAIREGVGLLRYAAFHALTRSWGTPQLNLRRFDVLLTESPFSCDASRLRWRELDAGELSMLSPTAQAWMANFLPEGEVVR